MVETEDYFDIHKPLKFNGGIDFQARWLLACGALISLERQDIIDKIIEITQLPRVEYDYDTKETK